MVLFVFAGFRDVSFVGDTSNYQLRFDLGEDYFQKYSEDSKGEVLYAFLNLVLLWLGIPFQYSIIVMSLVTCFFTFGAIYRTSKDVVWGIAIYILLTFYLYSFNAQRQMAAVAILLYGYTYVKEKKYIAYLVFVLIASGFHHSSLVALIAIPLQMFSKVRLSNVAAISIVGLSFIMGQFHIGQSLMGIVNWYQEGTEIPVAYSGFRLNLFLYTLFFIYVYIHEKDKNDIYLKLYFMGIVLFNVFSFNNITMRSAYTFTPVQILLFMKYLRPPQYRQQLSLTTIYALVLYYYMTINAASAYLDYKFCSLKDLGL